jgi:hypothetical protein
MVVSILNCPIELNAFGAGGSGTDAKRNAALEHRRDFCFSIRRLFVSRLNCLKSIWKRAIRGVSAIPSELEAGEPLRTFASERWAIPLRKSFFEDSSLTQTKRSNNGQSSVLRTKVFNFPLLTFSYQRDTIGHVAI